MPRLAVPLVAVMLVTIAGCSMAQGPDATNLRGFYRAGQVFLQWDEPEGLEGVRFRVLSYDQAITDANVAQATVLGDYLAPGSSTDWWLNPETYGKPLSSYPEDNRPEVVVDGWIIEEGGSRIAPGNGLFVHTVTAETTGPRFYAVASWPEEGERVVGAVQPGVNSLTEPISGEVALIEPLRALRMVHYAAWLARRWDDPAFPRAFPWFADATYWERHAAELEEQYWAVERAQGS